MPALNLILEAILLLILAVGIVFEVAVAIKRSAQKSRAIRNRRRQPGERINLHVRVDLALVWITRLMAQGLLLYVCFGLWLENCRGEEVPQFDVSRRKAKVEEVDWTMIMVDGPRVFFI